MKKLIICTMALFASLNFFAQNKTDINMFMKSDTLKQRTQISEPSGDLYHKIGHHGPAIENEWMALRIYFSKKCAIDVYNKRKARLELAEKKWYPSKEDQKNGWGADQYKVAQTVGLGGIRLWDGEKEIWLNPVKMRTARVYKEYNQSTMEMLSEGIPYKGDTISVMYRVTVYSGYREAKVEAFAYSDKPVQFLTGVNYFDKTKTEQGKNYICTWGIHPEDVAAFEVNIGAGIMFNPEDFEKTIKTDTQYELISKPTYYISTKIISSSENDAELNNLKKFAKYCQKVADNMPVFK